MKCILCGGSDTAVFYTEPKTHSAYFRCSTCGLRYLDPARHLPPAQEKSRYETHQNVASDPRYQEFQKPVIQLIKQGPAGCSILDFGCGAGPVIRHLLEPQGYKISVYDPFFYPDRSVLENSYDFIAAIEVVEHLFQPSREFALLRRLINPGGRLVLMTVQPTETTDFETWYYRRDPTHVAFYSRETLGWIAREYEFKELRIHSDRLAEFLT